MLVFTLSMPNVGSWNGQWTGSTKVYARIRNPSIKIQNDLDEKYFLYRWDDGWTARIDCKKVTAKESNKLVKNSSGFCGYDWMIDSILKNGEIKYEH